MSTSYLKYQGKKELRDAVSSEEGISAPVGKIDKDVANSYKKEEDGALDPSLFIIISGGEVRERDYFSFFKNNTYSFPRIVVEFISKNAKQIGGLDVDKLVELALVLKVEKENSKADDILDSINIVTDVDHFYSQLETNIPICVENDLNLIISNPCFELWLYYSYYDDLPDFEIPDDKLKISAQFKTYLGEKHKGGVDPRKAPFELTNAIQNSVSNFFIDKNGIPEMFSTQMHLLASKLLELTHEDIVKLQEIKRKERSMYTKS